VISDALFRPFGAPCVRRVPVAAGDRSLYLTFDDGPDPVGTRRVLDLLSEFGARATFFLIGDRARKYPELAREIRARGHAIGNHSPDHRYRTYFSGRKKLAAWIAEGERAITEVIGEPTIGFRPPAGVRTPELVRAVTEADTPLILWRTRFYDSVFAPKPGAMTRSLESASAGDIVLMHDSQREENLELFLIELRAYLTEARSKSFTFRSLERSHFHVRPALR